MKLLLVNVIDRTSKVESLFEPLGLGYIASYLRERFPGIEIKITDGDVEQLLKQYSPDIVGLTSVTQNYGLAKEYATLAKSYGIPVIIGGTHITSLPNSLSPDMDLAVIGEGEETIAELVASISDSGWNLEKFADIKGLAFRDGAELRFTGRRDLIKPLDKLPFPARDQIVGTNKKVGYLFSSRGCPYRCVFCASSRFWSKMRAFSPEYVVTEILSMLDKYNYNLLVFYDDLFIANRNRLRKIVKLIRSNQIHKRTQFAVSVRANLVDEEVVKLLRAMNVVSVNMGLESGSETTLKYLKQNISIEQNIRSVELLDKAGLTVNGSFVIGSPDETVSDVQKTLNFIKDNPLNHVYVYMLTPYPGTPIWDYALERGLVSEDMDWRLLALDDKSGNSFINLSKQISSDELYDLYEQIQNVASRKRVLSLARQSIRNPKKIVSYLSRRV